MFLMIITSQAINHPQAVYLQLRTDTVTVTSDSLYLACINTATRASTVAVPHLAVEFSEHEHAKGRTNTQRRQLNPRFRPTFSEAN